jgi:Flp pilus assembly protein TadG
LLTEIARSDNLGRIIKTGSAGKDRILLEKGIVVAVRALAQQNRIDDTTRDLLAYIALSLQAIGDTIDTSVAAWEKRGYWVKADHYRMEWIWTSQLGKQLQQAILDEDWGNATAMVAQVTQKLSKVDVPVRNRLGTPWVGSYEKLSEVARAK